MIHVQICVGGWSEVAVRRRGVVVRADVAGHVGALQNIVEHSVLLYEPVVL